ncbi:hypothetical protein QN372_10075 [Undibacterium sp. RTI2.1]|uniref:hypothetical protein n=1 Tax=unclassified Undibacterium TaxID=2630295 RepID=UPI002AB5907D|nr:MULTISPECIES: hypothetical protein [unclassified Undibacterium]MDY7540231.1 hypothetical protein [Undibacterium sp. 5I1]MEB0031094.1 hypothetical protein [Undibacterium sp. RTI2.1]MEB0115314.1 hypothetical protein [Undibacterium sp. RTI2.2]MEB0231413.1 hypothetical protein [Undibacterium sp. 10I3]MEB0257158.1 hypothetical protein [Undibacterium sp. 5I1]
MKKIYIALVLMTISMSANATYLGRFLCDRCSFQSGPGVALTDTDDFFSAMVFLKSTNITNRYVPGDIIAICDGVFCLNIGYTANGNFYPATGLYLDRIQQGYKNVKKITQKSDGESNEYILTVSGSINAQFCTWTDYYSDGGYIGSDSLSCTNTP